MTTSEQPTITCAIICYNYGRFLRRAIDSCLGQSLTSSKFEVLIIDDGSTDDTPEICSEYEGKIRVSRTANMGFPGSLCRAVQEAKGSYVLLLDADDYFAPGKLERFHQLFEEGHQFVHSACRHFDETTAVGRTGKGGQTSTIGFSKKLALDLLPVANELPFHIIRHCFKSEYIAEPLTLYNVHGGSMTQRGQFKHAEYFANVFRDSAALCRALVDKPEWSKHKATLLRLAREWDAEEIRERINSCIGSQSRYDAVRFSAKGLIPGMAKPLKRQGLLRTCVRGILWATGLHWQYRLSGAETP